jgi:hypothetical protein
MRRLFLCLHTTIGITNITIGQHQHKLHEKKVNFYANKVESRKNESLIHVNVL